MGAGLKILALILAIGTSVAAQEVQTEVQVAIDSAGTTMQITAELERKLGLFPGVEHFHSAQLLQVSDTSYILEIVQRTDGKLVRRRFIMSEGEAEFFRAEAGRRLEPHRGKTLIAQEARGGLIFRQTLLSLGFYGWAVPAFLDISDSRGAVAGYMLVSAGGFYVPYVLTKNVSVRNPHQMMSFYGATRGIVYGVLLEDLLFRDGGSSRSSLAFATLGSIGGSFLGFRFAERIGLSPGQAQLVSVMGDYGIGYGFSGAYLLGLYDDDSRRRLADAVVLGVSTIGLGAGNWLGKREDYTQGDAYVLRMFGILGAHLVLPIVNATGTEDGKAYAGGTTLGSLAGLVVGNRLLRGQSFGSSEGLIITSGQIAGGLLALGVTYLLDFEDKFDGLAYLTTSALGSFAGLALTFRAVSKESGDTGSGRQGVNMELSSDGIVLAALTKMGKVRGRHAVPLLRVVF